eukprot:TRINITY_DN3276_c0_g3_i3.p1 TRINITY_DN3276_c0_g3~~TRINITY_DN3276_c0_g3_i3.p1  ORF type:complete len:394 (-),score=74.47 TRINITY_DN3276_c0_g3_i3:18-1025(-)
MKEDNSNSFLFTNIPTSNCQHMMANEYEDSECFIEEELQISLSEFYTKFLETTDTWMKAHQAMNFTENVFQNWTMDPQNCCLIRELDFTSPVNAKIGPKFAKVHSVHRIFMKNPGLMIFEATSQSRGVPYGDTFFLANRFEIKSSTKGGCILRVITQIKFVKAVWGVKGLISSTAVEGGRDFCVKLLGIIKENLRGSKSKQPTSNTKTVITKTTSLPALKPQQPAEKPITITTSRVQDKPQWEFLTNNITLIIAAGLALIILLFFWSLSWRISSLETELKTNAQRTDHLASEMETIRQYVSRVGMNMDGSTKLGIKNRLSDWKNQIQLLEQLLDQ